MPAAKVLSQLLARYMRLLPHIWRTWVEMGGHECPGPLSLCHVHLTSCNSIRCLVGGRAARLCGQEYGETGRLVPVRSAVPFKRPLSPCLEVKQAGTASRCQSRLIDEYCMLDGSQGRVE